MYIFFNIKSKNLILALCFLVLVVSFVLSMIFSIPKLAIGLMPFDYMLPSYIRWISSWVIYSILLSYFMVILFYNKKYFKNPDFLKKYIMYCLVSSLLAMTMLLILLKDEIPDANIENMVFVFSSALILVVIATIPALYQYYKK